MRHYIFKYSGQEYHISDPAPITGTQEPILNYRVGNLGPVDEFEAQKVLRAFKERPEDSRVTSTTPHPIDHTRPFVGVNHGKGQIDLSAYSKRSHPWRGRPISVHLKEDGAVDDKPSLCLIIELNSEPVSYIMGEISLAMLNSGLNDIGYGIVKKNP